MRSIHVFPAATSLLLAALIALPSAAAPPVAPSPEPLDPPGSGVVRASLTADAAPPPSASGAVLPLPLPLEPSAPRAAAPRPLPDWRILAALGGAFAVLAAYRFLGTRRPSSLPPDVFEVLGEASLGGQQTARVIRFGPRTLLVGISGAGCQTLAELTDPQATEAIVTACRGVGATATTGRRSSRGEARA